MRRRCTASRRQAARISLYRLDWRARGIPRWSSFRSYLDLTREPLWAFGFGLSYTTFRLEELRIASPTIGPGGRTDVTVRVTNSGSRAGDEVVQLYIRDQVSSVTRPVKELRGFARVTL